MSIFEVPGNRQALFGMWDTDALNIININIDSIDAEVAKKERVPCKHENCPEV